MLLTITSSSDSVAKENDWLNSFRNSSIPAPVSADMLKHFTVEDISDVKSSCDEKSERVEDTGTADDVAMRSHLL